jgi:hypothetical protein
VKGKYHLEDIGLDIIILKWILKKYDLMT